MKAKLGLAALMILTAGTAMAQYKTVRGQIIPKNSLQWKVIRDRIEVEQSSFQVLVCRTFKVQDIEGSGGRGVIVGRTSQAKTYLDTFVLTNYPGSGGFTRGSEIHGPIMAFPVGEDRRFNLPILDYGTEYVPPPPKPGKVKAPAAGAAGANTPENGEPPAKLDAASVATFKFHLQKARDGDMGSQFRVAQLYLEGKGTQRDTNQAIVWFKKAKEQGNDEAANELKNLETP